VIYHLSDRTPYVASLPLEEKGYRIPVRGTVQLTLMNPAGLPLRCFLVDYDLSDMPPEHKTFLRQRICSARPPCRLHYLIHLRFSCPRPRHYYLTKKIKVIYPSRTPDESEAELRVTYHPPKEPRYFPY
jgi:hypothetical protein